VRLNIESGFSISSWSSLNAVCREMTIYTVSACAPIRELRDNGGELITFVRNFFKRTTGSFTCPSQLVVWLDLQPGRHLHDLYSDQARLPTAKKSPIEKPKDIELDFLETLKENGCRGCIWQGKTKSLPGFPATPLVVSNHYDYHVIILDIP